MNQPIKLSPIHHVEEKWQGQLVEQAGWQVVQLFSSVEKETAVAQQTVALCDQSHNGKIRIEGQTAAQLLQAEELAVNRGQQIETGHLYRLRQDLFFMHIRPAIVAEVVISLMAKVNGRNDLITITDITHDNSELWLVGAHSAELLSHLCGLDFHDSQFPNGTVKQSSVAKTNQLIVRRDRGDLPSYGLIGARSLAMYLWQTMMEAGRDLGIEPIGQVALTKLGY